MGKVFLKLSFTLSACIYQFVSKANAKQKATLFVGQSVYKHSVRRTYTKEYKVISHYPTEGFFQCCSQWTHCFLSALLSNDLRTGQLPKFSSEIQSSEPVSLSGRLVQVECFLYWCEWVMWQVGISGPWEVTMSPDTLLLLWWFKQSLNISLLPFLLNGDSFDTWNSPCWSLKNVILEPKGSHHALLWPLESFIQEHKSTHRETSC